MQAEQRGAGTELARSLGRVRSAGGGCLGRPCRCWLRWVLADPISASRSAEPRPVVAGVELEDVHGHVATC